MKIGISTGFADRLNIDIFQAIEIVSKTQIKTVELWSLFYGKQKHFNWDSKEEIDKIKSLLTKYDLEVYSIHGPFSYEHEFAAEDKTFLTTLINDTKQIIKIANELNAKCVVVHPVSKPNTSKQYLTAEEYQRRFNIVKSSLNELVEFILKHNYNIKLALENQLPHIMFSTFDEITSLLKMLNNVQVLGICLDTSHAAMTYNNNMEEFTKNFALIEKYVISTHFSDTDGKTDDHLVPGKGKIQWNKLTEVVDKLKKNNVPIILEILTLLQNSSIEETINVAYKNINILLKDWW